MRSRGYFNHIMAALISVVLIFSSFTSIARSAPDALVHQQIRTTRPFPQTRYIPDHDFDTRHIALDLHFDWNKEQLLGRETLVFASLVPNLQTIKLDAANITPTAVKLIGKSSSETANLQFVTDAAKEKVTVTLDRGYQPADELSLQIDYHTNGSQDPSRQGLEIGRASCRE